MSTKRTRSSARLQASLLDTENAHPSPKRARTTKAKDVSSTPTASTTKATTQTAPPSQANNATSPAPVILRSPEFYFKPSMVMLIIENTAFCLHRDLLSKRSETFRDMFSMPEAPAECEMMDGHPLVRLHDQKSDWVYFLRAFYGWRYVMFTIESSRVQTDC